MGQGESWTPPPPNAALSSRRRRRRRRCPLPATRKKPPETAVACTPPPPFPTELTVALPPPHCPQSWDADFFGDSAAQRRFDKTAAASTGLRGFGSQANGPPAGAALDIFFGGTPRPAAAAAAAAPNAPAPNALAVSSQRAQEAVALDTADAGPGARGEAATLYEAAAAALREHASGAGVEAAMAGKLSKRAEAYAARAAALRTQGSGGAE